MIIPGYVTYPTCFKKYKWYRPLVVLLTTVLIWFAFQFMVAIAGIIMYLVSGTTLTEILEMLSGGYDTIDTYSAPGAVLLLGSVATVIPSLIIAAYMIDYRPFHSYSSSRGGWNMKVFLKCLIPAFAVYGIYSVIVIVNVKNILTFTIKPPAGCARICRGNQCFA
ncbi:MAG: hypothetical protein IJ058_11030 [Lachnospiraceae bacterium]|nr:hypothetical protein [Lachnospiraceae bacterium]